MLNPKPTKEPPIKSTPRLFAGPDIGLNAHLARAIGVSGAMVIAYLWPRQHHPDTSILIAGRRYASCSQREMLRALPMSDSTLRHALRMLRMAGLISKARVRFDPVNRYAISSDALAAALAQFNVTGRRRRYDGKGGPS